MKYSDIFLLCVKHLEEIEFLHHIYGALRSMDLSAAVLVALQGMCTVRSIPYIAKTEKNLVKSSIFRNEGNGHFTNKRYLMAFQCYNKALLFAPKGSMELVLALSNRSALLFKVKAYIASYNDIETCLKLGCTGGLLEKLNKRKISCAKMIEVEVYGTYTLFHGFPEEFFKFNGKKHPEIPCLSADVDIISVSGEKKVAASKNIEIGTVVAVETAFTTCSQKDKSLVACYFCQKMAFNLIPCDNCCYALFCNTECQKRCVNEYHDIECQIMDVLHELSNGGKFGLIMKTVFKVIKKCKTWSKLIEESYIDTYTRFNSSSLEQIYNVENYSSILCFKDNCHFIHGFLFNHCFLYAIVLHYLEKIPGFFPASPNDLEAKKCFAELCMQLGMMFPYMTDMNVASMNFTDQAIQGDKVPGHYGWFPLTGKLNHSCDPNVLVIGLNNRVALVAVKPIKKMTEIKISQIGHFYNCCYRRQRASYLFFHSRIVCSCHVCHGSWGINFFKRDITLQQKKIIQEWKKSKFAYKLKDKEYFKSNCYALSKLEELVNTEEHMNIFEQFYLQLNLCQFAATCNVTF